MLQGLASPLGLLMVSVYMSEVRRARLTVSGAGELPTNYREAAKDSAFNCQGDILGLGSFGLEDGGGWLVRRPCNTGALKLAGRDYLYMSTMLRPMLVHQPTAQPFTGRQLWEGYLQAI